MMFNRHRSDGYVGTFTAIGVLIATGVLTAFSAGDTGSDARQRPAYAAAVEGTDLRCTAGERPQDEVRRPTTAVIRTSTGEVRLVPFSRGRDAYTGQASGTLLAVCAPESHTAAGFHLAD